LLHENRNATSDAVIKNNADIGIAWDGDFDRCFLLDEKGQFIEGYYIVGLLVEAFLLKNVGAKIIHDPRMTWNTIDLVENASDEPILCKTGHAFIKERMRSEDTVYGGEMSAHHYFKDLFYCDSGIIPWLLIAEMLSVKNLPLSTLVEQRIAAFRSSGEINRKISDPKVVIEKITSVYSQGVLVIDYTDGISIEHAQWHFNLRSSNTEPVVRLNVESCGDVALINKKQQKF
jgi:phosphomannomutase